MIASERRGRRRRGLAVLRILLAACTLGGAAAAAETRAPPDAAAIARGQEKFQPCIACHGATGNSEIAGTPSLAGQPPLFITTQLFLMREGLRPVPAMEPFARPLSDADMQDIAAFLAAQRPAPQPAPRNAALFAQGQRLARRHNCGACHLPGYHGQLQIPRLAGQREDYLLHAMVEYQADARPAADTSMSAALFGLSRQDLAALAHYLSQRR